MNIPFVDLKAQYYSIKEEIDKAIAQIIENSAFVLPPEMDRFESDFASYCGAKHAIGVGSGTSALILALKALGIGPGDSVITVPNTFIATAAAISSVNAKPVFVDIDEKTYNIDPTKIKNHVDKSTKAIIPVHLYGQPANMPEILEIAEKYDLKVVEDACQAVSAKIGPKMVGTFGDIGCFSFYPSKNLGAYGDAGCIITHDDEIAETCYLLRDHGQAEKNVHCIIGYTDRLDGLQGAVLSVKLKYLDKWTEMRRKNALIYNDLLHEQVITPFENPHVKHVYHLYVIRSLNRNNLINHLRSTNIGVGMHYPTPIHLQEAFRHLSYKRNDFPITEQVADEIISLPMYPELSDEMIIHVAEKIKNFGK